MAGGTIANLIVNVAADTAELKRGVADVDNTLKGFGDQIGKVGKMLAGAFTLTAIASAGKQILDFASDLTDLNAKTGISIGALQKFGYAFEQSGVSMDAVAQNAVKLSKAIIEGDKGTVNVLNKLGLSLAALKKMAPEDQFIAVGDAIGKIPNPTERAYAAMTVFGKGGAELLQGLDGHLKQTMGNFKGMSDQAVKSLDQIGDEFDAGRKTVTAWVVNLAFGFRDYVITALMNTIVWWDKFMLAVAEGSSKIPILGKHIGASAETISTLRDKVQVAQDAVKIFSTNVDGAGNAAKTAAPKLLGLGGAAEDAAKAADKASKAFRDTINWVGEQEIKAAEEALKKKEELDKQYRSFRNEIGERMLQDDAVRYAKEHELAAAQLGVTTNGGAYSGPSIKDNNASSMFGKQILTGLGDTIRTQFGPTIMAALTGGGSVLKSVGGLVGGSLSQSIFGGDAIKGSISSIFGKTLGGAFNSILPGIGALAGPLITGIGKLFGGLFGGQAKEVAKLRLQFEDAAGGMGALKSAALAAGISLDALYSTKKVDDFKRIAGQVQDQLKMYADEQAADATRLEAAIKKYGFAFEELGPKFQQQNLDGQAKELIEDWRVLVGSGIDLDLVNQKMATSINDYLQMALKTGAEVPVAMQPILQKMVEQGLLMDANGVAITDLGQLNVTWSESMTKGFDRVVEKLQELINHLNATGQALNNIPKQVTTTITTVHEDVTQDNQKHADPRYLPGGEFYVPPDYSNMPGFAGGTGGQYLDFGAGKPVMLHGRERVTTESEGRREDSLGAKIDGLRRDLRDNIRSMPIAIRDALIMAR